LVQEILGASDTVTQEPLFMSLLQKRGIIDIGRFTSPGVEAIISANPDLVIFYAAFYRKAHDKVAAKLPPTVKIAYFDLYIPNNMFGEVYKLGLIFDRVDRALEVISKWASSHRGLVLFCTSCRLSSRLKWRMVGNPYLHPLGEDWLGGREASAFP